MILFWFIFTIGPINLNLLDVSSTFKFLNLNLTFDTVATTLFCMLALLFAVVGQFAYHYLNRHKNQVVFFKNLIGILLSVTLMITSSSLLYVFLSWGLISYFLSQLLLYNRNRLQARLVVKKKFWISRIGDVSLLFSMLILYKTFGTLEFDQLAKSVKSFDGQIPTMLYFGIFFLCLSALVKSVQFPFHVWLPETMENPAPISAIMHAGIVNAGGILLIRASGILESMPFALIFVAFVGAFSAVFGSLIMLTQNDIKKKLAYSTISQMGIMIYACGIGLYSIALIHIIAHSLYKSHAFLSTGNIINESNLRPFKPRKWQDSEMNLILMISVAFVCIGAMNMSSAYLSLSIYGAVLLLGFLECWRSTYDHQKLSIKIIVFLTLSLFIGFLFYVTLESYLVSNAIGFTTLANVAITSLHKWLLASTFLVFTFGFVLKQKLRNKDVPWASNLYYFLHNGAYLNQHLNRIFLSTMKGKHHA